MVFFGLVIVMSLIGPFGTYDELSLYERFVFWVMITTGVGFFMHVSMTLALNSPRLGKTGKVMRLGLGAFVGALPGAAIVVFVNQVFRPGGVDPSSLPLIWTQVFVIGYVIGLVEYIDWREPKHTRAKLAKTEFHKRLPESIGGDIVSLTMQDHYVEVTTTGGKHLVLIRFGDALAELQGLDGVRIHRSHWVARGHLAGIEEVSKVRSNARLSDGRELPVSATFLAGVQGFLADDG